MGESMNTQDTQKRIGVFTSGGDSQGMNAGVRAVVRAGLNAGAETVSYTHLRAHETVPDLVCRLLPEKKKQTQQKKTPHISPTHTTLMSPIMFLSTHTL